MICLFDATKWWREQSLNQRPSQQSEIDNATISSIWLVQGWVHVSCGHSFLTEQKEGHLEKQEQQLMTHHILAVTL